MKPLPKSQILRFTEKAINLARRAVSRYSSKFSKHRYTLPQHVVLLCLKVRKNTTYRGLLDQLIEISETRSNIEEHWSTFSSNWQSPGNKFRFERK
jgi:hypothetical protein